MPAVARCEKLTSNLAGQKRDWIYFPVNFLDPDGTSKLAISSAQPKSVDIKRHIRWQSILSKHMESVGYLHVGNKNKKFAAKDCSDVLITKKLNQGKTCSQFITCLCTTVLNLWRSYFNLAYVTILIIVWCQFKNPPMMDSKSIKTITCKPNMLFSFLNSTHNMLVVWKQWPVMCNFTLVSD